MPSPAFDESYASWLKRLSEMTYKNPLLHIPASRAHGKVLFPTTKDLRTAAKEDDIFDIHSLLPEDLKTFTASACKEDAIYLLLDKESRLLYIQRLAKDDYNDKGIQSLCLVSGYIDWDPINRKSTAHTPLLLAHVQLASNTSITKGRKFSLTMLTDWFINPSVVSLCQSMEPSFKLTGELEVDLEAIKQTIKDEGISFTEEDVNTLHIIKTSSSVLYQDLELNKKHAATHPIIDAIVEQNSVSFTPPSSVEVLSVLDADSSQRQAIAAVCHGNSAVIKGPPGTGKSQTIVNIIANLIAEGKTVLMVSDKIPALSVIEERLVQVGLDEVAVSIYREANTKKIAQRLNQLIEARQESTPVSRKEQRAAVINSLDAFSQAIHEPKDELCGRSVKDVISEKLLALKQQPTCNTFPTLTETEYEQARTAIDGLTPIWERFVLDSPWEIITGSLTAHSSQVDAWAHDISRLLNEYEQSLTRVLAVSPLINPNNLEWVQKWLEVSSRPEYESVRVLSENELNVLNTLLDQWQTRLEVVQAVSRLSKDTQISLSNICSQLQSNGISINPISINKLNEESQKIKKYMETTKMLETIYQLPTPFTWKHAHVFIQADPLHKLHPHYVLFAVENRATLGQMVNIKAQMLPFEQTLNSIFRPEIYTISPFEWKAAIDEIAAATILKRASKKAKTTYSQITNLCLSGTELATDDARHYCSLLHSYKEYQRQLQALLQGPLAAYKNAPAQWFTEQAAIYTGMIEAGWTHDELSVITPILNGLSSAQHVQASALLQDLNTYEDMEFMTRRDLSPIQIQTYVDDTQSLYQILYTKASSLLPFTFYELRTIIETVFSCAPAIRVALPSITTSTKDVLKAVISIRSTWGEESLIESTNNSRAVMSQWNTTAQSISAYQTETFSEHLNLGEFAVRGKQLIEKRSLVNDWQESNRISKQLDILKLHPFYSFLNEGSFQPVDFTKLLEKAHWERKLADVRAQDLTHIVHDNHRKELAKRELQMQEYCRDYVKKAFLDSLPTYEEMHAHHSKALILIKKEAQKKKAHISIREFSQQAGALLPQLARCVLATPEQLAKCISPENQYDYVIVDEASQLTVEKAVPCLYRAAHAVILGDQHQLPPTSFFASNDERDYEPEEGLESILDVSSTLFHTTTLKWHYRSRHHSLITYSNEYVYDKKLVVFPGVYNHHPQYGVTIHSLEDHQHKYSSISGNKGEAAQVLLRLKEILLGNPKASVGIVAMGARQQTCIQDMLAQIAHSDPDFYDLVYKEHVNLFVKNIENVQGNERDIILISFGYGYNEAGTVSYNFGPLGSDNGKRRWNVAVTRAREKVELFTSFPHSELAAKSGNAAKMITNYLELANTATLRNDIYADHQYDSPLEEEIAGFLMESDFVVHSQIGVKPYHIDLAIISPHDDQRYIVGVECDGATYHSHPDARDRDRLRQQQLESLGWNIVRVWSTDWWYQQDAAKKVLLDSIQEYIYKS